MDKKRVFDREEFAADLRDVSAHLQMISIPQSPFPCQISGMYRHTFRGCIVNIFRILSIRLPMLTSSN